jgi:hypothetical protein
LTCVQLAADRVAGACDAVDLAASSLAPALWLRRIVREHSLGAARIGGAHITMVSSGMRVKPWAERLAPLAFGHTVELTMTLGHKRRDHKEQVLRIGAWYTERLSVSLRVSRLRRAVFDEPRIDGGISCLPTGTSVWAGCCS